MGLDLILVLSTGLPSGVSFYLFESCLFAIQSRSTTQIWVVTRRQYGISALVRIPRASFGMETSGDVTKCWLFHQANIHLIAITLS